MRGKTYLATHMQDEDYYASLGKAVYIFNARERRVNSSQEYRLENHIVKPGHEVFVLRNTKTGKQARAKAIFVAV